MTINKSVLLLIVYLQTGHSVILILFIKIFYHFLSVVASDFQFQSVVLLWYFCNIVK